MKARDKVLIVDGYNVLRSGSRYRQIQAVSHGDYTDDTFNTVREELINDVLNYAGLTMDAIIVFDGGQNAFSNGEEEKIGNLVIVFSPAGMSADKVIERYAHVAKERGKQVLVVSSDASIQDTVFSDFVTRMSAEGFCRELDMHDRDVAEANKPAISRKNTIAERIDAASLEKLKALRDGR